MSDPRRPSPDLHPAALDPAARERAVEVLTRAFAEDRISEEDLEARLERVYRATTIAELNALATGLVAPAAAPSVPAAAESAPEISAFMSAQEQALTGVVPRALTVRGRLGYVELDLSGAAFQAGETVIDARAFMGYVQIRFPATVRVACQGHAVAGYFALKGKKAAAAAPPPPDAPLVRITGRAAFGFVECLVKGERAGALDSGGKAPRLKRGTS